MYEVLEVVLDVDETWQKNPDHETVTQLVINDEFELIYKDTSKKG